jgi:acylphosphatase
VRRRYLIAGRVQGVGYRFFTRRSAARLGVSGWVRNLASGQVEAESQGSEDALNSFEAELRRGPPGCLVTEFAVFEISDEAEPAKAFLVR